MFQHVTGQLVAGERLPVVRSAEPQKLVARAYTAEQVRLIAAAQTPRNALATELAYAAGLRAHELLTLRPATERPADPRPALASKWRGRDGERYTVAGKGGLVREVLIPQTLATRLEAERRSEGTHLRVERDAREKLQMRLATPDVTLYVGDARAPAQAASPASGARP